MVCSDAIASFAHPSPPVPYRDPNLTLEQKAFFAHLTRAVTSLGIEQPAESKEQTAPLPIWSYSTPTPNLSKKALWSQGNSKPTSFWTSAKACHTGLNVKLLFFFVWVPVKWMTKFPLESVCAIFWMVTNLSFSDSQYKEQNWVEYCLLFWGLLLGWPLVLKFCFNFTLAVPNNFFHHKWMNFRGSFLSTTFFWFCRFRPYFAAFWMKG